MPYSDNLYSAIDDESDNESFSSELSPTDGFNRSPIRAGPMVADPSLDRKDAAEEDKVLIPRSETRNESGSASRSATSPTLGALFPSQNYASSQSNNNRTPTPSSTSNAPSSPAPQRRTHSELFTDPVNSSRGPPPAYSPPLPTTSSQPNHNRSHSTFISQNIERGLPESSQIGAQSMGRSNEDPDERTPLSSSDYKINNHLRRRNLIRKLLFIALVFAVIIGIMTAIMNLGSHNMQGAPTIPGGIGKLPDDLKPPDLGLPGESSGTYCASATINKTGPALFSFGLDQKVNIIQETHEGESGSRYQSVRTSGEIRLRRLPKGSSYSSKGIVSIDVYVSDESLQVVTTWDEKLQVLRVSVPRNAPKSRHDNSRHENCISLEITVWLPEDALLSELGIGATMLALRVFDDSKFKVTGRIDFSSISGDIYFPEHGNRDMFPPTTYPIYSRHIKVETVSGNIRGIYPLYDYLKLASQSGDIKVGVYPQAVLREEPAPADLEVSTSSGKVEVIMPVQVPRYDPPARDYVTHVSSISGKIEGSFFLGSAGSLRSTSGDIKAKVLPVIQYSPSTDPDDAPKSQLETWTASGDHNIELLEPVFISLLPSYTPAHPDPPYIPIGDDDPYRHIIPPDLDEGVILDKEFSATMQKRRRTTTAKKWRTLTATHKSTSANVKLQYPTAWEGTVTESTISGDTKIVGKDLEIISFKKGWPYKELIAGKGVKRKGEGSTVSMDAISGDLKFSVGSEE